MDTNNFDVDYDKLKDNKNGAIVALVGLGVTAMVALCKYGIDALGNGNN